MLSAEAVTIIKTHAGSRCTSHAVLDNVSVGGGRERGALAIPWPRLSLRFSQENMLPTPGLGLVY